MIGYATEGVLFISETTVTGYAIEGVLFFSETTVIGYAVEGVLFISARLSTEIGPVSLPLSAQ